MPHYASLWRTLILEGNSTHTSPETMGAAQTSRVQLMFLPSHSSHLMLPLNVDVFSPLQSFDLA